MTLFSYETCNRISEILGTNANENTAVSKIFFTEEIGIHLERIVPLETVMSGLDGEKRIRSASVRRG